MNLLFKDKEVHIDKENNEISFKAFWPESESYKEEDESNVIEVNFIHPREEDHNKTDQVQTCEKQKNYVVK